MRHVFDALPSGNGGFRQELLTISTYGYRKGSSRIVNWRALLASLEGGIPHGKILDSHPHQLAAYHTGVYSSLVTIELIEYIKYTY